MVECELHQHKPFPKKATCFNRYMVECELTKIVTSCFGCSVLIDTWWNVNSKCFASFSGGSEF